MTETTTYSFKAIWDTIYNKMLEIATWDSARIWAVYNHDIKIEDWINYPAIIITPDDGNIKYLDSCSYESEINYTIRLIDRIQKNIADVEDNMRVVADMMLQKLKEIESIVWSNDDWYTVRCTFAHNRWFANTQEPIRVFNVKCYFTAVSK